MQVTAEIKYLKISPKKMKSMGKAVVGLSPKTAIDRLSLLRGEAARLLLSAIKSVLANAQNNFKADTSTLRIKTVIVLKGPMMKRWQPVSRGMAHQIKKKMSHVKVILEEINVAPVLSKTKQIQTAEIKKQDKK